MKPLACLIVALLLSRSAPVPTPPQPTVVLPSPDILRCAAPACQQLWPAPTVLGAIYPHQVAIDFDRSGCVYGLTAYYDASVPFEMLKSALDASYKQSAVSNLTTPVFAVWRVESLKFAIQLSIATKKDQKTLHEETGTKQLVYIAFGGRQACATH